jgi:hypothetical protein
MYYRGKATAVSVLLSSLNRLLSCSFTCNVGTSMILHYYLYSGDRICRHRATDLRLPLVNETVIFFYRPRVEVLSPK